MCNHEVHDWMAHVAVTIQQDQTIREALDLMGQHRVSAIPVLDDREMPVGILTIGDFMRAIDETDRVLESSYPHYDDCLWAVDFVQKRLGSDKVYHLMSELLSTATPTQSMSEAAGLMSETKLHHLLVCHKDGSLAGMLSASDFVRMVSEMELGA